jgi:hypothetical protein
MSTTIDLAFIKKYEAEVHVAYQQMGSKLRNTIRTKNGIIGVSTHFPKVGKGIAGTKTRHGKVPVMNVEHSTVECTLYDYYAGDWVDKLDELKTNIAEQQILTNAGAYALGRKTDNLVINSLDGATHTTSVDLSAITKATFLDRLTTLGGRDVPVEDGGLYGLIGWATWGALMKINEFVNADFIGGGDLPWAKGPMRPKAWLGVTWIPHTGLNGASSARKNYLYHRTALGHAIGAEVRSDITWHGDRAAHFINNMMSQGAVLIDNDGVEEVIVDETA